MIRPEAKGWCPSAYRPMESGDGLIVRLKPRGSCFKASQLRRIGLFSEQFGNGIIDITTRANLQIRGVTDDTYPKLLALLKTHGIVHSELHYEQVNLVVSPSASDQNDTRHITETIYQLSETYLDLPAKFGFALDTGAQRQLTNISGDIRIERGQNDGLLLRCDGLDKGFPSSSETLERDLTALLDWFQQNRTAQNRRMKHLSQIVPATWSSHKPSAPIGALPTPSDDGRIVAPAYGQIQASRLPILTSGLSDNTDIFILPNRCLMLRAGQFQMTEGFITNKDDPRLTIATCSGMPACKSAQIKTRALADDILSESCLPPSKQLHISACSKGCASAHPTDICITGSEDAFDIIENGCAWQSASVKSLSRPALYGWLAQQK